MKVTVLLIKPAQEPNCHVVSLTIGEDRRIFRFTTKVNQVGDHQIQTTQGDREFSDWFRFNQRVAMNVSQLVVKFYNKEAIELPANVGNFVTPEEALSKLKPFEGDRQPELIARRQTEGQTEAEVSQQVRQKAIALVENLPESLLDRAVKLLVSLSVKANHPE